MGRILPILFNTDMVCAILDGRKTVTRRVIKPKSKNACGFYVCTSKSDGKITEICDYDDNERMLDTSPTPPAYVGDILYVRETWCWCPCWDCGMDTEEHNCCNETAAKFFNHDKGEWGCYCYKASCEDDEYPSVDTWHPSIHMPKEAARIWLKVTDVRIERLQDITEQQAEKEGFVDDVEYCVGDTAVGHFAEGWEKTIKKQDMERYGWKANPWVWAIQFKQCKKPEGWRASRKRGNKQ